MDTLSAYLTDHHLDALLVTNFYNILYLTGLKTLSPHEREAYLLITKSGSFVFTDGRYEEQFRLANRFELRVLTAENHILKQLQSLAVDHHLARLGFEREDLKWSEFDALKHNLSTELVPVDRLILRARALKDNAETEAIARACRIGDECLEYAAAIIRPGMTEKQIAWQMEKWVREKGYAFSFEPIVAVDANAAVPHYNTAAGAGKVGKRSLILIDMGIVFQDYCSDITRMFFMSEPEKAVRSAYEALRLVQEATVDELSYTAELRNADLFCRGKLEAEGYPSYPHSTGHGVGLEVHEYPKIAATSIDKKAPGQVFTVEPGIYLPGRWGMRIEDTVAVEGDKIKSLTKFPKGLFIL